MKIGIISDTHGITDAWLKAMKIFEGADLIIHGGDVLYHPPRIGFTSNYNIPDLSDLMNSCGIPILIAKGNCDSDVYEELLDMPILSPCAYTQINNLKIMANHGHTIDDDFINRLASKKQVDILITGHTHIPIIRKIGELYHCNPGSPSHPKWKNAEGVITPTVGIIENNRISIVDLNDGSEMLGHNIG